MPGIHVRSLGKLDWVEHGNEPVLTIPGAYWLCHKKHIYKFTFKWHKTLRNTEGFAYPKELTKVIRRIIKSQPRQGQQFGTRHLLVTYNHSAWMRQDKMFAMLKFRERTDATAFPHAFVLTVQTLNDSSNEEQSKDKNKTNADSKRAKDERVSVIDEKNKGTENNSPDNRRQKNHDRHNSKPEDRVEDVGESPSSEKSLAIATSSSSRECDTARKKDPGKRGVGLRKSFGNVEYLSRNKMRARRRCTSPEKKIEKIAADSPAEKGIAADFADLPYQYIIEKEIESSKSSSEKHSSDATEMESSPGPSNKEMDLPGKSLPRSPKAAQAETARSADITDLVMEGLMFTIRQDDDSVTVVEQKTKLEMDEVLVNSEKAETKEGEKCLLNSSLLRLENLITKIEMSEARSKCYEDTARSPRIITNDTPIKSFIFGSPGDASTFDYGINNNAENDRATPKKSSPSPPSIQHIEPSPMKNTPKFPLVKINLGNARDVLSDELRYDHRVETPEAAKARIEAMEIDQDLSTTNDEVDGSKARDEDEIEEEDEVGLELRYDDQDDCEPDKPEEASGELDDVAIPEALRPEVSQDCSTNVRETTADRPSENVETSPCDHSKCGKNPPRVISNEVVTVDQIPPAMQKALKHTRFKRTRFSYDSDTVADDTSPMEEDITNDESAIAVRPTIAPEKDIANERSTITSPLCTINITEEFYRELANEKTRKQPARRKSLRQVEQDTANGNQVEEPEIRLDMWKFMQDMTHGAKVVVRRLDLTNFPNGIASGSSLVK